MKLRLADHELDSDYIRYARTETLKALRVEPHPDMLRIPPFSTCVLAVDEATGSKIGMGESAMLRDAYGSYEATPYADIRDLNDFCPLEQMGGMRTVFVEQAYRTSNSAFLALTLGSIVLFYGRGARFATASTRSGDEYLNRLYAKWGGERVGTFCVGGIAEPTALFVFDLTKMLNHRVMKRITQYVTFEFEQEFSTV